MPTLKEYTDVFKTAKILRDYLESEMVMADNLTLIDAVKEVILIANSRKRLIEQLWGESCDLGDDDAAGDTILYDYLEEQGIVEELTWAEATTKVVELANAWEAEAWTGIGVLAALLGKDTK